MDQEECPVILGPSSIHGVGVFAKRDIKFGEVMAFYDGEEVKEQQGFNSHGIDLDEQTNFIGYKVARTSWGIAQFINDSVSLQAYDLIANETHEEACYRYIRASSEAQNTIMQAPIRGCPTGWRLIARASRDIRKGEELKFAYGCAFWLRHMVHTMKEKKLSFRIIRQFAKIAQELLTNDTIFLYQDVFFDTNLQADLKKRCIETDLSTYTSTNSSQSAAAAQIADLKRTIARDENCDMSLFVCDTDLIY